MTKTNPFTLEFQPLGKRITTQYSANVLEEAHRAGVSLASDCGGQGKCGRCRIEVVRGEISPPDQDERKVLERVAGEKNERLACKLTVSSDMTIEVPQTSETHEQVLELGGRSRIPTGDWLVTTEEVELPTVQLGDQGTDLGRLLAALPKVPGNGWHANPELVRDISILSRSGDGRLTVFLRNDCPVTVAPRGASPLGIAVDIGTTTIAGRLLNLCSGEELAVAGKMNPQISAGEDVIARLTYAIRVEGGARTLASTLRASVDDLASELCEIAGVSSKLVTDVVICGNSAISHLFLELPAAPLAKSPYIAGFSQPLVTAANQLELESIGTAQVTVLPCIGGFIGGDHVAMILACDLDLNEEIAIGIDIGTNSEVVLSKPGKDGGLFVTSCASGPALEGAHIRDGMRAAGGAIEKVKVCENSLSIKTVGDSAPVGICGSGLLDAVAALFELGVIDNRGHLRKSDPRIVQDGKGAAFRLVGARDSGTGRDILITQKDISEIQLAKGAMRAGLETLLEQTGTSLDEIGSVYLAGAFGSHINIDSAIFIGLFPHFPEARFIQAGNAAVNGASLALMSKGERQRASLIAEKAQHLELASTAGFNSRFVRAMRF